MRKAIAVFDIDGTVLSDTSAERIFVRYLLARGALNVLNGAHFVKHFLTTFPRNGPMATKGNRFYLKGKGCDRMGKLAEECFGKEIVPKISEIARRKIEEHRACGLEIILLSGILDMLLRCFQEYLGAHRAYGSTLSVSDGRYTGDICGIHPYGRAKAEIVQTHYGCGSYDLSASYAYADHLSDLEFLGLFGHPALVNPSPRVIAKAKKEGMDTFLFW